MSTRARWLMHTISFVVLAVAGWPVVAGAQEPPGWCCHNGELTPLGQVQCRNIGGMYFDNEAEAERHCRPDEPHSGGERGWCCVHGEVFPASPPECEERGGGAFGSREEAERHCRPDQPRPGDEPGWCCLHGEVFPAPPHECEERGGGAFGSREEAERHCRPDEPRPGDEPGWCCLHGEVFPAPPHECEERGGGAFGNREEAERRCRQDEPHPGDGPAPGEGEPAWCCHHGEVFPAPPQECEERGGRTFPSPEEAERHCRADEPHPGDGPAPGEGEPAWCCHHGEVFPAPPQECEERGGRPFPNPEEAERHCRADEPRPGDAPPAGEGEAAWCCQRGEVFPAPPPECEERGGRPFPNPEEAERHCRADEPHPGDAPPAGEGEAAWCCQRGEVFPAPPPECEERGGRPFPNPEEAERHCRPEVPHPDDESAWCCRDGEVSEMAVGECHAAGGRVFATQSAAERACAQQPPDTAEGWCCTDDGVIPTSDAVCGILSGRFATSQREAARRCTPAPAGWCCAEGEVTRLGQEECHRRGGELSDSRDAAAASCAETWASYELPFPVEKLPLLVDTTKIRIDDVSPGATSTAQTSSTQWGRMLALDGSGKEKISGPVTSWTTPNGAETVEHLAAKSTDDELMVFYWQPGHDWKGVNVSDKTGRKIAGPPVSWTSKNGPKIVEHLAAQGPNGDLLVFYWQSGQDWKVVDVTAKTGRKVQGAITAWTTPVEHLAASSPNGDLLVFLWQPHTDWVVVDVSKETGQKIAGPPTSWTSKNGPKIVEHVAAQSPENDLLVFYWQPEQSWRVVNVTAKTGHKVQGAVTAWMTPVEHLAARSLSNDLLVFLWQPHTDWVAVDVGKDTGQKIAGPPTSWTVNNGKHLVEHVAARAPNDDLMVFFWEPGSTWKVVNVSAVTGPRVAAQATSWTVPDGATMVEHVAAQARNGDLIVFYWSPDHDWQPINVTTKAAGRVIYAAAPKAGVWKSDDYGNTWRQLTRPQPASGAQTTGGLGAPTVLDVAVSPVDPEVVLAAVRDDQRKDQAAAGVYYSSDGGETWKLVYQAKDNAGNGLEASQVRFAPDDPKLVYAAVGAGIAVSKNGGATWDPVSIKNLGNKRIWHIAIGPTEASGQRRLYGCGDGTVWHSPNGGTDWYSDSGPSLPSDFSAVCEGVALGKGTAAQIMDVEPGHPERLFLAHKNGANGPRYFAQIKINGKMTFIDETDGIACNTNATLSPAHQKAAGKSQQFMSCGEGSVWLGDFSTFATSSGGTPPKATWSKMPGPPVYWVPARRAAEPTSRCTARPPATSCSSPTAVTCT